MKTIIRYTNNIYLAQENTWVKLAERSGIDSSISVGEVFSYRDDFAVKAYSLNAYQGKQKKKKGRL